MLDYQKTTTWAKLQKYYFSDSKILGFTFKEILVIGSTTIGLYLPAYFKNGNRTMFTKIKKPGCRIITERRAFRAYCG
jgi:hypothetical protein